MAEDCGFLTKPSVGKRELFGKKTLKTGKCCDEKFKSEKMDLDLQIQVKINDE